MDDLIESSDKITIYVVSYDLINVETSLREIK